MPEMGCAKCASAAVAEAPALEEALPGPAQVLERLAQSLSKPRTEYVVVVIEERCPGLHVACGVPAALVTIGSVRAASMRRSLGGPSSVQVSVLLSGAGGLTAVPHHLGELHLDDAWEVDPQVRVFALAGQAPARRI
jgi:hypothetical protein